MTIYFATGNEHKRKELQSLLQNHTILIPKDYGIDFCITEDADSFLGNSIKKAKTLFDIVKAPVIADDSGLCVRALGDAPGIFSARYTGNVHDTNARDKKLSSEEQCRLLIQELNATSSKDRSAYFVCAMTLYLAQNRFYVVQEVLEGAIIPSYANKKGNGGFGYDPIFFLKDLNKTVAELTTKEKNTLSHRAKAAIAISKLLE